MDIVKIHKWVTYTIKKDHHYCHNKQVATFSGNELSFIAVFDESAKYSLGNSNQSDINKLYGFTDCTSPEHENSARFGWNWDDKKSELRIYAYCYKDGNVKNQFIKVIELNKEYNFKINVNDSQYTFNVDGTEVIMDRGCSGNGGIKYYCFPYFGGNEKAPHDISIRIKE
jgi:hypothetical protein